MTLFYGRIENGKIILDRREAFSDRIHALNGAEIQISLDERELLDDLTKLRGYFHAVVLPRLAMASGESNDPVALKRVKRGLKERFLTVPAAPGEPVVVRSTESLSKSEYAQFIFHCRRYAAETFFIDIEDPR